jgi:hypothetical protein
VLTSLFPPQEAEPLLPIDAHAGLSLGSPTEEAFMLSCVLAMITCVAIPVDQPLDVAAQMPSSSPAAEVGAYVTTTSFRCRNFSSSNYVLVFGQSGTSVTVTVPLSADASVAYAVTPETLQGVYIEVVAVSSSSSFASSGSITLALPANSTDMSLWFVRGSTGLLTWRQNGCDVELVQPGESLVPSSTVDALPGEEDAAAAQAPVAVPTEPRSTTTAPQSLPPM